MSTQAASAPATQPRSVRTARLKLAAILAVCAAPVIASYLTYYVIRPEGRTNYGTLIEPQRPVGAVAGVTPDGRPFALSSLAGKWMLVVVAGAECDSACAQRLFLIRQVRLTTGRDRDRIERVVLTTGGALAPALAAEHEGLHQVRIAAAAAEVLPATETTTPASHIYIVDPLGNLMMRFPADPDPNRMKKDLAKLLRASRIG